MASLSDVAPWQAGRVVLESSCMSTLGQELPLVDAAKSGHPNTVQVCYRRYVRWPFVRV